jgi:hypothetical protein
MRARLERDVNDLECSRVRERCHPDLAAAVLDLDVYCIDPGADLAAAARAALLGEDVHAEVSLEVHLPWAWLVAVVEPATTLVIDDLIFVASRLRELLGEGAILGPGSCVHGFETLEDPGLPMCPPWRVGSVAGIVDPRALELDLEPRLRDQVGRVLRVSERHDELFVARWDAERLTRLLR